MKKIIYLLLTILVTSCTDNSEFVPSENAIFGYSLSEFSTEDPERYGNGECWGTLQTYSKDEIKIVVDKLQCSDYNLSKCYLLFKNDKITTAHSVIFETILAEETENKRFSAIESIYSFAAEPPTILRRTDVLEKQNLTLIKTNFDTLKMENVEAEYVEFTNRLLMAKSQILKDGEIPISISHGDVKIKEKTFVPQMEIFMTSPIFGKTVLLTNDFNLNEIETKEKRQDFGIPNNAIFAFYSWFGGKGNCYYGIIENAELVVSRKTLKEQKTEEKPFEIFKKFPVVNSFE